MSHNYARVAQLLNDLEQAMRQRSLWSDEPPAADAFASTIPFCYDRMGFDQWLQFVFLPRIGELVDTRGRFPGKCDIAPLAEVWCEREQVKGAVAFIHIIRQIDQQLTP